MDDIPKRVIVYACVTNIPGDPQRRHNTLGEILCKRVLGREFHAKLQPPCYDHVHIPADFDSEGANYCTISGRVMVPIESISKKEQDALMEFSCHEILLLRDIRFVHLKFAHCHATSLPKTIGCAGPYRALDKIISH